MAITVGMLVNDDGPGRKTMAEQLRRRGVYVVEADSVGEAVALAQLGRLHVVIVSLSGDPALDLCHRLRSLPTTAHLPVIVVGSPPHGGVDTFPDAGVTMWLSGQKDADELHEVVQQHGGVSQP